MVLRRRRYESLGLLKSSQSKAIALQGVKKFVADSQVNDIILYNRVTRARPTIGQLDFADDDVDWPVEYFCGTVGKWMGNLVNWLLGIFESFMNFLGWRRKDSGDDDSENEERKHDKTKGSYGVNELNLFGNDWRSSGLSIRPAQMNPDIIWRFENCIPCLHRRFLKRKWWLSPTTREWATERMESFQRHVMRGFRALCSGVGKDTKIYVVCSPSEVWEGQQRKDETHSPKVVLFRADSKVLLAHSITFRQWFEASKEKTVVTTWLTPQEMQAILVYMYTLTWPTDVVLRKQRGKRGKLNPRFLEVLASQGMSLALKREEPPEELMTRRSKPLSILAVEQLPGGGTEKKDVNLNMPIDSTKSNLASTTVLSSMLNFTINILSMPDSPCLTCIFTKILEPETIDLTVVERGDCLQSFQSAGSEILQYISETGSPGKSRMEEPLTSSSPPDLSSSVIR